MHLFLIRHGQSTNNANPELSTRVADPPLTDKGQHQAQQLADYILHHRDSFGITEVIASPMLRAMQTASPLAQALQLPLHVWPDICEFGGMYLDDEGQPQGISQPGMTRPQIMEHFPFARLDDTITDVGWWTMPSGREAFPHVIMRVMKVLAVLQERAKTSDRVALVSHGLFIDLLLKGFMNLLPGSFETLFYMQYNTGITYLQLRETRGLYSTEVLIEYINSRPHLVNDLWTD